MRATNKITTVSFEGFNKPRGVFGRTVTVCVCELLEIHTAQKDNQILIKRVFITKKNTQTLTICLLPKISLLPGYVGQKKIARHCRSHEMVAPTAVAAIT